MKSKTYEEFKEFCKTLNKKYMNVFLRFHLHYDPGERASCVTIMLDGGIGLVRLTWYDDDEIALISDLHVVDCARRIGLGGFLLLLVIETARFLGFEMIQLKVLKQSWMEEWYKKVGFIFTQSDEDGKYDWMIAIIGKIF